MEMTSLRWKWLGVVYYHHLMAGAGDTIGATSDDIV